MEIFYILLLLLVITRFFGEITARLGQPALVGEIISGIALGLIIKYVSTSPPLLSYYSDPSLPAFFRVTENQVFIALTDLGIFFLMLLGGVELRTKEIAKASSGSAAVAMGSLLLPLFAGFNVAWLFIPESSFKLAQCLFVGVILAITAVPVSIRVLMDLGQLHSPAGKTIISAAVVCDVLGLVLLAILLAIMETGELPSSSELLLLGGQIFAFFGIAFILGLFIFPRIGWTITQLKTAEFEFTALLIVAIALGMVAELLQLHFVLGAFLAGLFFERQTAGHEVYEDVKKKISAITSGFLGPIFFASIGLHLEIGAFTAVPLFLFVLILVAIVTKLIGGGLPAYGSGLSKREALGVGVGMSGRGATELIVADIALRAGLFLQPEPIPPVVSNLFSVVVIIAILTTITVPVALRYILIPEK